MAESPLEQLKPILAALSAPERAELASFLLHSLDQQEDVGAEAAWDTELARRVAEMESGKVVGIPAAQVFAELREKYS